MMFLAQVEPNLWNGATGGGAMVKAIIALEDTRVSDVMTPRVDLKGLDLEDPPADLPAASERLVELREVLRQVREHLHEIVLPLLRHQVAGDAGAVGLLELAIDEIELRRVENGPVAHEALPCHEPGEGLQHPAAEPVHGGASLRRTARSRPPGARIRRCTS